MARRTPFEVAKVTIVSGPNLLVERFVAALQVDGSERAALATISAFGSAKPIDLAARPVDLDLQIGRHAIRLAQRQDVLAAAAFDVAADGVARRHVGGFGN